MRISCGLLLWEVVTGLVDVGSVRSGQSVQPDVMTNVSTPLCLRLKGPAEVYADAVVTQ